MRHFLRYFQFCIAGAVLSALPLISVAAAGQGAQVQDAQRPTVRATIVLRDKERIVINRGAGDGLRKGDKLTVIHEADGRLYRSGTLLITHVYRTTSEAIITQQIGAVGPEDTALFDPAAQVTKSATPPTTAPPSTPPATAPAKPSPAEPAKSKLIAIPIYKPEARKEIPQLPLLAQFSTNGSGAAFMLDYTNDTEKDFDTALYRTSAHLILDNLDYRTQPVTLTGNYSLEPGKSRSFSFHLSDFMVTKDTEVWPLKPGRHTILIKFGGKDYGPLTFDWRGDSPAVP
jgi:hypothetical protein